MAFFLSRETEMTGEMCSIEERIQEAGIGLREAFSAIDMALGGEDLHPGAFSTEVIFGELQDRMERAVRGSKIARFRPGEGGHPFHVFEIRTDGDETLGYLNMMYLRKPIPCHYLVYVEVLPPFRGQGLGNRILGAFREFVEARGTVGILDNIIPEDDPTFDIYSKMGWQGISEFLGRQGGMPPDRYMVYVPARIKAPNLGERLVKLLFNVKKKRPVIDMQDNEAMVKRTIEGFRSVRDTLSRMFRTELAEGTSTPMMRYMFTNLVTKLLGFRRRISDLLGYTGGESLGQITLPQAVQSLAIQPFSMWGEGSPEVTCLWEAHQPVDLPGELLQAPTRFIEALPFYRRPYLSTWAGNRRDTGTHDAILISDLLELGFDPTRLREMSLSQGTFIWERLSPRLLSSTLRKGSVLSSIAGGASDRSFAGAKLRVNPPLILIRDLGNVYVLRRRIPGIHLEEALDQLRSAPHLREVNRAAGIDRALLRIVGSIQRWLQGGALPPPAPAAEEISYFVPWDLGRNYPRVFADPGGVSVDTIWLA
jgi:GNAT superfamily N-acetyltransferase